jgi:uncharacterized protein DUF3309
MPLTMNAILVIAVGLLLMAVLPVYPYSRDWGYAPTGLLGLVLLVVLLFLFL